MTQSAPRLSSEMLVSALIRRVFAEGGFATVLQRGDSTAGAILLECVDRGARNVVLERTGQANGQDGWRLAMTSDDSDEQKQGEWLVRRRAFDPDLWVVELDTPHAERFAAEILGVP